MRAVALAFALLSGCSDPAADAERRKAIAERNGDKDEACRQARLIAEARLNQEREGDYRTAKLDADMACSAAELKQRADLDKPVDALTQ